MALRFTASTDGRDRANVTVSFRVGYDRLLAAAADLVWDELVEEGINFDVAQRRAGEVAGVLTRSTIEGKIRASLRRGGYEDDRPDDALWDVAYAESNRAVELLWPELAAQWKAAS